MKPGANIIFSTAARAGSGGVETAARDDYQTPPDLFAALDAEFYFDLDAAADAENALGSSYGGPRYIDAAMDALQTSWGGDRWWPAKIRSVFCNPPYSLIDPFVRRAVEQARAHDLTVVLLVPARTGRAIWRTHVWGVAHEIRFISGRLRFGLPDKATASATFDSAVVVYRGRQRLGRTECLWIDRQGQEIAAVPLRAQDGETEGV